MWSASRCWFPPRAETVASPAGSALADPADVEGGGGGGELVELVPVHRAAEVAQQTLAAVEQERHDGDVQLVDQSGAEVLPNRGRAAAEDDVVAACRGEGPLEGGLDAVGDELETRAVRQLHGLAGVV